jgi:hypothetical protein
VKWVSDRCAAVWRSVVFGGGGEGILFGDLGSLAIGTWAGPPMIVLVHAFLMDSFTK